MNILWFLSPLNCCADNVCRGFLSVIETAWNQKNDVNGGTILGNVWLKVKGQLGVDIMSLFYFL